MAWEDLIAITREAQDLARVEDAPPVACPNCGEPLESARGVLHCPFDGYQHS